MRSVFKADNLPPSCAVVTKSGNRNFLEASGPVQACNGAALPSPSPIYIYTYIFIKALKIINSLKMCYIYIILYIYIYIYSMMCRGSVMVPVGTVKHVKMINSLKKWYKNC